MNLLPVPVSDVVVAKYASYLARRLSANSVRQYLNVVRLLHQECNEDNPCNSWFVRSTLRGIDRLHGKETLRKSPILPDILMRMHDVLNLSNPCEAMFWAAALVLFFGTFRKSNLMPNNTQEDTSKQFKRCDFVFKDNGIELCVRWSKTIQNKERSFVVLLPKISHVLCPVTAVSHAFALCPLPDDSLAFVQNRQGLVLTSGRFNALLKRTLDLCGIESATYSSHSFRRGSATWALQCGIPGEVVKLLGDWKSNVYLSYLDQIPVSTLNNYRKSFSSSLPR